MWGEEAGRDATHEMLEMAFDRLLTKRVLTRLLNAEYSAPANPVDSSPRLSRLMMNSCDDGVARQLLVRNASE